MRRNGVAGVSWGVAPRLRNGIRLQADMRPARATLIDALQVNSYVGPYWALRPYKLIVMLGHTVPYGPDIIDKN